MPSERRFRDDGTKATWFYKPDDGDEDVVHAGIVSKSQKLPEFSRFCNSPPTGVGQGEHRSVQHEPDTERGTSVPGIERCATSSKGKETGTVHRSASPYECRSAPGQLLRAEAAGCARRGAILSRRRFWLPVAQPVSEIAVRVAGHKTGSLPVPCREPPPPRS
jgi:hypothetical protein